MDFGMWIADFTKNAFTIETLEIAAINSAGFFSNSHFKL
jgi:hypothetical protein